MVWGAISRKGRLPQVFIEGQGAKINAEYYKTEVLERILLPEAQKLYGDEYYCPWANIPEHVVHAACDAFDKRLDLLIKAQGQSIE
jgi:hypothetical protein